MRSQWPQFKGCGRHFKLKLDLSQTLTKWFLSQNLTRHWAQCCHNIELIIRPKESILWHKNLREYFLMNLNGGIFWSTVELYITYGLVYLKSLLKVALCRNWYFVRSGTLCSSWVQHHGRKYKCQVCKNWSDVRLMLTTNKSHYEITMLCLENLYLQANMDGTLWSYPLTEDT